MNKLQKLVRSLWIRVQLGVPPPVRSRVLPYANDLKEIARLLAQPGLPVFELSGSGAGGPLTVTFVNSAFARRDLEDLLFTDTPTERQIGRVALWRWRAIAISPTSDILVVGGSRHLVNRLPSAGAVVLPESVTHVLDLSGDWPAVEGRFHRSIRRELQRDRQYGYSFAVSSDERDFDEFYRRMYLPTMQSRHGRLSRPMPRSEAHQYFERGYLLQVWRDDAWVAATICQPIQSTVVSRITGVRGADPRLVAEGAAYQAYLGEIRTAHERGYREIDFLGTGPYLASGMLQHKRRWGTTVRLQPQMRRRIWVRVARETPAVARFLKDNPLIAVDEANRLHGLIATEESGPSSDETRAGWRRRYATPGLDSLIVRPVSSFVGAEPDDLILPIAPALGHTQA